MTYGVLQSNLYYGSGCVYSKTRTSVQKKRRIEKSQIVSTELVMEKHVHSILIKKGNHSSPSPQPYSSPSNIFYSFISSSFFHSKPSNTTLELYQTNGEQSNSSNDSKRKKKQEDKEQK